MKRLAAFAVAFMLLLCAPFCAFALDESFALDVEQWQNLEGSRVELVNQQGLEGAIKYYIDAESNAVYADFTYKTKVLNAGDNIVYIMVNITKDGKTQKLSFDKNGFLNGSGKGFELVGNFGNAANHLQQIIFAFQCPKSCDLEACRLQLSISVNGNSFDFLDYTVPSTEETTTEPPEKETQTTEKSETTTSATTKPSDKTSTTKFTPPADADYFSEDESASDNGVTVTEEYGAEQVIEAPEAEEEFSLSNPAKLAIACAAALAIVGAALIVKGAISAKNKKAAKGKELKNPKIDEESKEIIDRYINDDYDIEE